MVIIVVIMIRVITKLHAHKDNDNNNNENSKANNSNSRGWPCEVKGGFMVGRGLKSALQLASWRAGRAAFDHRAGLRQSRERRDFCKHRCCLES